MTRMQLIRRMLRARRDPACFGDFGLLKMELFGGLRPNPGVLEQMSDVVGYHPRIDLAELATLPAGSFGRIFADHMMQYRITPLNVSSDLEDIAQRHVIGLRYLVTHDMFPTLLGFDTSYAGEMGVYAFARAQEYSSQITWVYRAARVLYPVFAPTTIGKIRRARRWGLQMGREAKFLLGYRFEDNWHRPLDEIRAELGVTPAATPDGSAAPEAATTADVAASG